MDLQTVEDKLKAEEYSGEKDFEDDVDLIWNNALLFNLEGSEVNTMAKDL